MGSYVGGGIAWKFPGSPSDEGFNHDDDASYRLSTGYLPPAALALGGLGVFPQPRYRHRRLGSFATLGPEAFASGPVWRGGGSALLRQTLPLRPPSRGVLPAEVRPPPSWTSTRCSSVALVLALTRRGLRGGRRCNGSGSRPTVRSTRVLASFVRRLRAHRRP